MNPINLVQYTLMNTALIIIKMCSRFQKMHDSIRHMHDLIAHDALLLLLLFGVSLSYCNY